MCTLAFVENAKNVSAQGFVSDPSPKSIFELLRQSLCYLICQLSELRGPAAILLRGHNACSDSIEKFSLVLVSFYEGGGISQASPVAAEWGSVHMKVARGVLHPLGFWGNAKPTEMASRDMGYCTHNTAISHTMGPLSF